MGAYRLVLSILVLLSHVGINFHERNIGVPSVVSFFLLSGFVMTTLIDKHYLSSAKISTFYLDRAIRLFPQYLFYLAATGILLAFSHPQSHYVSNVTVIGVVANISMLPMNFYRYFANSLLIPQAWSLGLEAQFYLLIPLILIFRLRFVAFVSSFCAFLVAYFGFIDSGIYGYRMISGTLFFFIFGSYLRRIETRHEKVTAIVVLLLCVVLLCMAFARPSLDLPSNVEVLSGFLIGFPVVAGLSRLKFGPIESFLGNLSYGVFLNQFFLLWVFENLSIDVRAPLNLTLLIGTSIVLAWFSYSLVERPAIALRHRLRNKVDAERLPT